MLDICYLLFTMLGTWGASYAPQLEIPERTVVAAYRFGAHCEEQWKLLDFARPGYKHHTEALSPYLFQFAFSISVAITQDTLSFLFDCFKAKVADSQGALSQPAPAERQLSSAIAPFSVDELVGFMAKPWSAVAHDDIDRLLRTSNDIYEQLISHPDVLADTKEVLLAVSKHILSIPKIWVWYSMSETCRKKFAGLVCNNVRH